MYKLILLILTLSGFLIYKAAKIKVVVKPAGVTIPDAAGRARAKSQTETKAETKPLAKNKILQPASSEDVAIAPTVEEPSQREQFDSLRDVYENDPGLDEAKLTQHEREIYEKTLQQIKTIESEDAARKNFRKGVTKSPDQLTEEEQKLFDVYKTKEDNNE